MEQEFFSLTDDDVTLEELAKLRQFIPEYEYTEVSQLAQQAMDDEKKPTKVAQAVGDFAQSFIDKVTVYDLAAGRQTDNPLLGEAPYRLNSASFVYWSYKNAGINLRGGDLAHSIQTIKKDFHLKTIGNIGSNLPIEALAYGDIVFFHGDRHIGIYIGDGKFVSYLGKGQNDYSGGAKLRDMQTGKWRQHFEGHVLRHREEA